MHTFAHGVVAAAEAAATSAVFLGMAFGTEPFCKKTSTHSRARDEFGGHGGWGVSVRALLASKRQKDLYRHIERPSRLYQGSLISRYKGLHFGIYALETVVLVQLTRS